MQRSCWVFEMRAIIPKLLLAPVVVYFVVIIVSCDRLSISRSSVPSSGPVAGATASGLVELNDVRFSFYLSLDGVAENQHVECFIGIIGAESSSWHYANEICTIDNNVSFRVSTGMAVLVKYDQSNGTIERVAEIKAPSMEFAFEDTDWGSSYARKCLDELLVEASGSN